MGRSEKVATVSLVHISWRGFNTADLRSVMALDIIL